MNEKDASKLAFFVMAAVKNPRKVEGFRAIAYGIRPIAGAMMPAPSSELRRAVDALVECFRPIFRRRITGPKDHERRLSR